jgi:uncharacterized protein (DUF2225 family)
MVVCANIFAELSAPRVAWTISGQQLQLDPNNFELLKERYAERRSSSQERFVNAKRNETFVMMEYFGYLRRDADESGFRFWLNKLNQFGGNFEQAEMVKAFINSGEYRDRFRP